MANGEECNVGGRSFSWLLGSEILQAIPPKRTRTVIATPTAIEYYDDPDYPPWQTAINSFFHRDPGPPHKTLVIGEDVKIDGLVWDFDFAECPEIPRKGNVGSERHVYLWLYDFGVDFSEFIEQVRGHVEAHGEVRFVFGFS